MKKLLGILGIIALTSVSFTTFAYEHSDGEKPYGEFRDEIKEAVEADDYASLSEEAQENISQEEFAEHVEKYTAREEHHDAIEEAVANNDFDAFVALHEDHEMSHDADYYDDNDDYDNDDYDNDDDDNDDDDNDNDDTEEMHKEKRLAMMQEHFASLVTYYNENGELPSPDTMEEYFAKKKSDYSEKHMQKKMRKHFKANHKQFIRNVIQNADEATLEILLEKIEDSIENVEGNESMDAARTEILLDMLGGIYDTVEELLAEISAE